MRYEIRNKDTSLLTFDLARSKFGSLLIENIEYLQDKNVISRLLCMSVESWLDKRKPAKNRPFIDVLLAECNILDLEGYINTTYCLSLNDTLWVVPLNSSLQWGRVSLYSNPFSAILGRLAFDGTGLCGRGLKTTSPEFTTNGMLPKCWKRYSTGIYLLKGGTIGASNSGLEPYSEVLATQLLNFIKNKMLLHFIDYSLAKYHGSVVSKCALFTSEQSGFKSQATVCSHNTFEELYSAMELSSHHADFLDMLFVDALLCNVDRHLNNFGYLTDNSTGVIASFAPIFDNGLGCLPYLVIRGNTFKDKCITTEKYLDTQVSAYGISFENIFKVIKTKKYLSCLVALKDFKYTNPGFGFTDERTEILNHALQYTITKLLKQ